jgi:hypothetical protein
MNAASHSKKPYAMLNPNRVFRLQMNMRGETIARQTAKMMIITIVGLFIIYSSVIKKFQ